MLGSTIWAVLAWRELLWCVDRSPYCENFCSGLVGLPGGFLAFGWVDWGNDEAMPPMVEIDSAVASSLELSSGPDSSSRIIFRFAGRGRVASEGGFLVMLRP